MQVVKTNIISLNFKLKQLHFELAFRLQYLANYFFLLWLFYFVKGDYQAIKAHYRKKGEAYRLNRKRRYFGTFRAIPI